MLKYLFKLAVVAALFFDVSYIGVLAAALIVLLLRLAVLLRAVYHLVFFKLRALISHAFLYAFRSGS